MDLINANLLFLLPLAAIPVVLHLLTLHRLKTVELSTFRFLFDSYVQQRRRMKFLEALLAFLRTMFLLLLVFVCGRPVLRHWSALFGGGAGRDVVLLVDCSASMNAQTAGLTSLQRAKTAARSVVKRLNSDDRLTLVRVAARPEEVFTRFSSDAEAIDEHIEALTTSPSRGNWFMALSQVFGSHAAERSKPTVYLFTDCQASGWRELEQQGVERLVPDDAKLVVVNVGSQEPLQNRAIVGSPPVESRAIVGLPLVLRARVANDSKTEAADVTLSTFIDEKEIARSPLMIKAGDTADKAIIFVPTEPGMHRGRFQIGDDRFPDDDQYLFTLSVEPQIKVLLVNGNPSADPFENDALYLRTALTARGEEERQGPPKPPALPAATSAQVPATAAVNSAQAALTPGKEYVRSLDVREIPEAGLNPEALRDASVVVLANCGGLNQQHFAWLREFVSSGGGLMIFPGDRVNPDVYNTQFFVVPGPRQERLVPVKLGQPVGDAQKFDTFAQFSSVAYEHPALRVFDDREARYLTTTHVYRRFPLLLDEKRADGTSLLKFSLKEPALIESRFHDGRVLLAAFPASAKWTNLPLKPEFVPLLLRLVNYVEHRPEFELKRSVVPAGGAAEVEVAATWSPRPGEPPVCEVNIDQQSPQPVEFERAGSRWVGGFEGTALKGYYLVEVKGGTPEKPRRDTAEFAVNLAADESKFVAAGEEQLREWLPGVDLTVVDATAETQQEMGAVGNEHEIWRGLLLVVFAIIGIEFMLATLGGRKLDTGDDASVGERIKQYSPGNWVGRMTGANEPVEVQ
ncbi:MAG TPA: VWA domain-containing protein [Pirellulales bacterium]|nr:VWA domain-containing protein [Pirellulales bacterium]